MTMGRLFDQKMVPDAGSLERRSTLHRLTLLGDKLTVESTAVPLLENLSPLASVKQNSDTLTLSLNAAAGPTHTEDIALGVVSA
jgi:hypothetical protein